MTHCYIKALPMIRGQSFVIAECGDRREVLYRSRDTLRSEGVAKACRRAFERGEHEALFGWPRSSRPRGLFKVVSGRGRKIASTMDPHDPELLVMELHPRMETWDAPLYVTTSQVDAELALAAIRRAASLGCLSSISHHR